MSDENEISEAGRKARFERWEQLGVDVIRTDLEATGGLRFVGGPPSVRKLAWEWVRMKEAGSDDRPATAPRKRAAKPENKDEWITAAEAVRLLKPIFGSDYSAQMTICSRAHAGLIRARAEHFMIDDRSADRIEVPKQFWWAEGHQALKQNWTAGDFETWIEKTKRFRAFGVSFLRADIEKLIPAASKNQSPKEEGNAASGEVAVGPHEWDVFISHASEDKDDVVRPLAESLREEGLRVWFDEFTLTVGDSLQQSIDFGLARSRFGIVVISPNFLQKDWPKRELGGLVAREINAVKVILPVWHNIDADQIRNYSPMHRPSQRKAVGSPCPPLPLRSYAGISGHRPRHCWRWAFASLATR